MSYVKEFREWVDFGPSGRAPDSVSITYLPDATSSAIETHSERIEQLWEDAKRERSGLFDAPGFRLLEASEEEILLGPARFKHHFVRRLLLSGSAEVSAPELRNQLRESVRYLSSMVAIVAGGDVLFGVKRRPERDFLSLPGSGYLDRNEDMRTGELRPTAEIIAREVYEETGLEERDQTRCFGVFEDVDPDSHLNPALFSVVVTPRSSKHVIDRTELAEDADEFDRFFAVPLRPDAVAGVIRGNPPDVAVSAGIPRFESEVTAVSDKTLLALLLLGRKQFGRDWFRRELANSAAVLGRG
jgi:8-oxo-dGTP pyrophosphatase MutT (NUDIX family)